MLSALGFAVDDAYLAGVMASFDADGSGSIEQEEFATLLAFFKPSAPVAHAERADVNDAVVAEFERRDSNSSGRLEPPEIKAMLSALGFTVDDAYLMKVMTTFDADGSGSIEREEFPQLLAFFNPAAAAGNGGSDAAEPAASATSDRVSDEPPPSTSEAKPTTTRDAKSKGKRAATTAANVMPEGMSAMEKVKWKRENR